MIFRNSIVGKMVVQFGIFVVARQQHLHRCKPATSCVRSSALVRRLRRDVAIGKHYYVIGAVTATGTLTSLESSITVANSKVTINWTAPVGISGVTGYKIYRGTTLGGETLIATVSPGRPASPTPEPRAAAVCPAPGRAGQQWRARADPCPDRQRQRLHQQQSELRVRSPARPVRVPSNPIPSRHRRVESASSTPNTVSLSPGTLVGIDQGLSYSQSITASGGTGTGYLIGITAGALPPGFTHPRRHAGGDSDHPRLLRFHSDRLR